MRRVEEETLADWGGVDRDEAEEQARRGRIVLPGARLLGADLNALIELLPGDPAEPGRRRADRLDLSRTTVHGACRFEHVTFGGPVAFVGTDFRGGVHFSDAHFEDHASFEGSRFGGVTVFLHTQFTHQAEYGAPRVEVSFSGAWFLHPVSFFGSHFEPDARFSEATFEQSARFQLTTFAQEALFDDATFGASVDLLDTSVDGSLRCERARFRCARRLGPVRVAVCFSLDDAVFEEFVRVEAAAGSLSCRRAVFRAGADLLLRWAVVSADDADFSGPSLLAGHSVLSATRGMLLGLERPDPHGTWIELNAPPQDYAPQLVSLRGAKVARLTLSGVDLRQCHFSGAHGLDAIRLERVTLREPPRRPRVRWRGPVPTLRWRAWTRRQTIAEEHAWRIREGDQEWGPLFALGPAVLGPPLDAAQVAAIYRALRKSREDGKDQSGAGDFYYGEMEMRRRCGATEPKEGSRALFVPRPERCIIWLYWLVSGYGLRASRALAALALTLTLLAVPLDEWGFRPDRSYGRALLFAVESTISPLRAPAVHLTASGEVLQIALRLAGPLLLGLAALALRNRVKR